jgi:phosphohistidine phosphatase
MRLLLMRHGVAEDNAPTDAARQLTPAGARQVERVAGWLVGRGVVPGVVLHSPLVRARQTAERFAAATGLVLAADAERRWLGLDLSLSELTGELQRRTAEVVLVVGHQPRISTVTARLCGGGQLVFRPASVACVEFPAAVDEGQGQLEWLLDADLFDEEE